MKNRRKLMTAFLALAIAMLAAVGAIFAWFIKPQSSMVIVTGDADFQVKGYYAVVSTEAGVLPEYIALNETLNNNIKNLDQNHYISFRFDIENVSETDINLSLRLSEFSEYIFDLFPEYKAEQASPSETLNEKAKALATAHTAKFTLVFDDVLYRAAEQEQVEVTLADDGYLWRYADSEKIAENIPLSAGQSLTLSFSMVIRQSMEAIDAYRAWLCGTSAKTGYGQTRCANLFYNKTFDALTDEEKALVDAYLAYFMQCEIDALNTDDTTHVQFNLDIDYFEFIGENAVKQA